LTIGFGVDVKQKYTILKQKGRTFRGHFVDKTNYFSIHRLDFVPKEPNYVPRINFNAELAMNLLLLV
jgi:hypothetical protein